MSYLGIQTQVRKNNQRSVALLILFPVIILALTWLFFFVLGGVAASEYDTSMSVSGINQLFLEAAPWVFGACLLWFLIAYLIHSSMITSATHSHSLSRTENKRVYNLVENLCMADGVPMPKLNVIEDDSINAFASGINQKTYAVTLTRGAIDKLDDDELEGVIAHELTHIKNRDVRLLIVSIIFVGIFSFIANVALRAVLHGGNRGGGKKGNGAIVMMVVVMVLAAIGYLISMLLRFSISRKREFMADAGAVQMTKKPQALASALRKISGDSHVEAITRDDVAQLFIEHTSKKKKKNGSIFATHPPIEQRIEILEQF